MCIENESTGKYTCSHAPYTRFTSVVIVVRVLLMNLRIYDRLIVCLELWYFLISRDFVFYTTVKVACKFGDRNIVLAKCPLCFR